MQGYPLIAGIGNIAMALIILGICIPLVRNKIPVASHSVP